MSSRVIVISAPSARSISSSGSISPFLYLALIVFSKIIHLQNFLFHVSPAIICLSVIILISSTSRKFIPRPEQIADVGREHAVIIGISDYGVFIQKNLAICAASGAASFPGKYIKA